MNISYVAPIRNNLFILDRDEKRVGKYMEQEGPIPAPIRVSHKVRKISICKIPINQEKPVENINSDFYRLLIKTIENSFLEENKIEFKENENITLNFQHDIFLLDRLLNQKSLNNEAI